MAQIFAKQRLSPTQLRTVSDRRFDDAQCLLKTGQTARANGAMYLGGFVIECLLKAHLLVVHGWLQTTRSPEGRSTSEQRLWNLCYRSHELDEILDNLPSVTERLQVAEREGHSRLLDGLKKLCGQWTIYARYSPRQADIEDAREFLSRVKEVKKWLR